MRSNNIKIPYFCISEKNNNLPVLYDSYFMKKLLVLNIIIAALLFGCKSHEKDIDNEFVLSGNLYTDEALSLTIKELTTKELIPVDTINTDDNGNFVFRKEIENAGFYILRESTGNSITLLVEPGENIELSGKADSLMGTYEVTGSKGSILLMELNKELHSNIAKVDSLADLYRESRYDSDFEKTQRELNEAYTNIFNEHKRYVKDFIEDNPYSLATIIALYQYFGDKIILKETEHFEYFDKLSKTLAEVYPTNKHVINLKKKVSEIKREKRRRQMAEEKLAIGNPAPEIALPDPEGNTVELSSLEGNIVLIDFWASWHKPCHISNQILSEIYDKYNDQGFEIYAVSLDRTHDQWVKTIKENNIDWIQVSDLRYFNSPVVNLYNIKGLPYTILLDREGNIVARDVDHRELDDYLEELL